MAGADVVAQVFQLALRAEGGKISDLRLERTGQIGRRIDDGAAKLKNAVGCMAQLRRQLVDVGIEPDAQQGVVGRPRGG
jgi:hypothetical protein